MQPFYLYIYLDPRRPGRYCYKELNISFLYEPFYIGQGIKHRYKSHLAIINHPGSKRTKVEIDANPLKCKILNDIYKTTGNYPLIEKIYFTYDKNEINDKEKKYIKTIGRRCDNKGPLTNILIGARIDNSLKKGKTLEELYGSQKAEEIKNKVSKSVLKIMKNKDIIKKLKLRSAGINNPKARKIYKFDINNNFLKEYSYINEAVKDLNLPPNAKNCIISCARGRNKTAYGFIWKYERSLV